MTRRKARGRVAFYLVAAALGVLTFLYASPAAVESEEALDVLVTTFSVLAGILIAVYTVTGDPGGLKEGESWRHLSVLRREVLRGLKRYDVLMYLYLVVLAFAFLATLWRCSEWIARLSLSLGVCAFVLSFGLPRSIARAQKRRWDKAVEQQLRRDSGGEAD